MYKIWNLCKLAQVPYFVQFMQLYPFTSVCRFMHYYFRNYRLGFQSDLLILSLKIVFIFKAEKTLVGCMMD